jgi:hypothetical protein
MIWCRALALILLAGALAAGIFVRLRDDSAEPIRQVNIFTPPIAQEIAVMPEIRACQWFGPSEPAKLTIIHLRDWHFVPRELCQIEGISFEKVLADAAAVQESQLAIARRLIKAHGLTAVYSEGLSKQSVSDLKLRLDVLKDIPAKVLAESGEAVKHLSLEVGTPGRLWLAGDIADVLPLEDEAELQAAKPVVNGKLAPNKAKIEARREAMVAQLPKEGLALIVLGGSHDLGMLLPPDTLYIQVTPRGYPE